MAFSLNDLKKRKEDNKNKKISVDLRNYNMILYGVPDAGKAQFIDMTIPTPSGDISFRDIQVGSEVFDRHGKPTTVTGVYPQGVIDCYRVEFADGRSTLCNDEHIWSYMTKTGKLKTKTLKEMMVDYKTEKKIGEKDITMYKYKIPTNGAVQYLERDLYVDPYLKGLLLSKQLYFVGDTVVTNIVDNSVLTKISAMLSSASMKSKGTDYKFSFDNKVEITEIKKLKDELTRGTETIPSEYLMASVEQRLELLKGILDGGGTVTKTKDKYVISFATSSEQLKSDIVKLCFGLGYTTRVTVKGEVFTIKVCTDEVIVSSLKLLARTKGLAPKFDNIDKSTKIVNIEKVEPKEMVCIMVDNEEHLYLCNDYIVTHNTTLSSALFQDKHILLACEYGTKSALYANDVPVASYKDLREITKTLATKEAYEEFGGMCIVDTLTRLGEIITNYILSKYGKDFLSDVKSFNGAYSLIDKYYGELFSAMKQVGWSFCYVCHSDVESVTDSQGNEYDRFILQTNKRLAKIISKEADLVWFINKQGTENGQKRILTTNETQYNFGKNKVALAQSMPLNIELANNELDSAKIIVEAFEKACEGYGSDRITTEVGSSSVEAFKSEERDIEVVKAEMIEYGGKLTELDLRTQAIEIMNRALGTDYNGEQRTMDTIMQESVEALEIGLDQMKELYNKHC